MKNTLTILLSVWLILPVFAAEKTKIILSGKIKYPNSDTLRLEDESGRPFKTIRLNPNGSFRDTVELKQGLYHLNDGKEYATVWLQPGFDLQVSLDTRKFDESLRFKGIGSSENNYLAGKYMLEENLESKSDYRYYARKPESGFLSLMDSLETVRIAYLNKHKKGMDAKFYDLQKMVIEYGKRSNLYSYESMHGYLTANKSFKVSEHFPSPFTGIDLNRAEWVDVLEYTEVISDYLYDLASKDSGLKHGRDYYLIYLENLESKVQSKPIQSKLAAHIGLYRLGYTKHIDSVYTKAMPMITDTSVRNEITHLYSKIKNLKKGFASPGFSFPDRNGLNHTLESLRGKLVYIDVWATWCGPCIAEMPALAKLQDSLKGKDIVFVSICTWDERENWLNFLEKREPEGLQLFAEDGKDPFLQDYVIQGVPRFILLDREGRIINADAARPSDARLLPEILDLLK